MGLMWANPETENTTPSNNNGGNLGDLNELLI